MLAINNTTRQKINLKKTQAIGEEFLRVNKKSDWEISLAIVGDAAMRRLNRDYRGQDKTTDVLSFSVSNNSGEIIINIQEAKRVKKYGEMLGELGADRVRAGRGGNLIAQSQDYIFYFLLVHGLLHLVGYDDKTDKERRRMLKKGKEFLEFYFRLLKKVL
jgi:probable rRNA maturation factor